ncbi:MAG: hypothetical protein KatS3mg090_0137 [Patescibacteria group bacterium]|nr:MAG: hypothetical protein KatS3mg090_0137 [Patescibacteria group bacterium]
MKTNKINWSNLFSKRDQLQFVPPNCVDGRAWSNKYDLAPQFLGGSFHFVVVASILWQKALDWFMIESVFKQLNSFNYKIGLHRGSHKNAELKVSDCGFVDNIAVILKVLKDNSDYILKSLPNRKIKSVLKSFGAGFSDYEIDQIREKNKKALAFVLNKGVLSGDKIIAKTQDVFGNQAVIYELEGEHREQAVLLNLSELKTFDTLKANQLGCQAFNLDLKMFYKILKNFKLTNEQLLRSVVLSLVLYQATEKVLVEDKGKKALPMFVFKG